MTRRALITGITGQDGWYLTELLAHKGYEVHGVVRDAESAGAHELCSRWPATELHTVDLVDSQAVRDLVAQIRPHEVYNLAAPSFVPMSWQQPVETAELTAFGPVRLLEAIRQVDPTIRFCQAGSREMFGASDEPLDEQSPCRPLTPYGAAKAYAHWMTATYRHRYGMFAASAILFNHESPRRGPHFVTRKITLAAARIKLGLQEKLTIGHLSSVRDWGYAGDTVQAMWLMLQQPAADDYVLATGQPHTIGDVVELAFRLAGLDWRPYVQIDASLAHAADLGRVCGDSSKARRQLGWQPEVNFEQLIQMMVETDLRKEAAQLPRRQVPSR